MARNICFTSIDEILSLNLCKRYPVSRLLRLGQGRESITISEILLLDDVPIKDRLYFALNEKFFDRNELLDLGIRFANRVLSVYENFYSNDSRPRRALDLALKYTQGQATQEEINNIWNEYVNPIAVSDDPNLRLAADTAWSAFWSITWNIDEIDASKRVFDTAVAAAESEAIASTAADIAAAEKAISHLKTEGYSLSKSSIKLARKEVEHTIYQWQIDLIHTRLVGDNNG